METVSYKNLKFQGLFMCARVHICVCVHVRLYIHSNLCLHCIVHYTVWDLGGQTSIRPYWRCYYSNTDAIIYVVDSADRDRLAISKSELVSMLEVSLCCAHVHMAGLMMMASHRTFSGQKACVWPNYIWPDKFTIHYQWKYH